MLGMANLGPSETMCLATFFVQFHGSCCLFSWLNVHLAVPISSQSCLFLARLGKSQIPDLLDCFSDKLHLKVLQS